MVSITIDAKLDQRSSSRGMLLTQPPVMAVALWNKARRSEQYCTIYNRTGVTILGILGFDHELSNVRNVRYVRSRHSQLICFHYANLHRSVDSSESLTAEEEEVSMIDP